MNIKYPKGTIKNKEVKKVKTYGNRGMTLEDDLNLTNNYYLENNIAIIHKKPTPIQVTKTSLNKITLAYFKEPSTTDYNGLYKGKYIDFEAKETTSKTSFPLENIHKHQIEYIRKVIKHNGIVFLIVRFSTLNRDFVISGKDIIDYINNNERKSIPLSYFENNTYEIGIKYAPRLDYIKIVDKLINEHNN